jgi:hypothetical protein
MYASLESQASKFSSCGDSAPLTLQSCHVERESLPTRDLSGLRER